MVVLSTITTTAMEQYWATAVFVLSIMLSIYGCLKAVIIFRSRKSIPFYLICFGLIASLMSIISCNAIKFSDTGNKNVWILFDSLFYFAAIQCTFASYFYRMKSILKLHRFDRLSIFVFYTVLFIQIPLLIVYNLSAYLNVQFPLKVIFTISICTVWILEFILYFLLARQMANTLEGSPGIIWILKTIIPLLVAFLIELSVLILYFACNTDISWVLALAYITRLNAIIVFFVDLVEVVEKGKIVTSARNSQSSLGSTNSDFQLINQT